MKAPSGTEERQFESAKGRGVDGRHSLGSLSANFQGGDRGFESPTRYQRLNPAQRNTGFESQTSTTAPPTASTIAQFFAGWRLAGATGGAGTCSCRGRQAQEPQKHPDIVVEVASNKELLADEFTTAGTHLVTERRVFE